MQCLFLIIPLLSVAYATEMVKISGLVTIQGKDKLPEDFKPTSPLEITVWDLSAEQPMKEALELIDLSKFALVENELGSVLQGRYEIEVPYNNLVPGDDVEVVGRINVAGERPYDQMREIRAGDYINERQGSTFTFNKDQYEYNVDLVLKKHYDASQGIIDGQIVPQ